jgi:hypothetical protein
MRSVLISQYITYVIPMGSENPRRMYKRPIATSVSEKFARSRCVICPADSQAKMEKSMNAG